MLDQYDEVASLLHDVPLPPGESLPVGADRNRVEAAFQRIGVAPSDALVGWLGVCNGWSEPGAVSDTLPPLIRR
jgi:hypothetical protein